MTVSEIVFNIKNLMSGGVASDDFNLSDEQIIFIVNYYRAKLAKQDDEKGKLNKSLFTQNLGKVSIKQAGKNECCDGDCILRSTLKIPKPLESITGLNISFVGTSNGTPFSLVNHNAVIWRRAAKYTKNEPTWYYQNGYIYLVNPPTKMLNSINIQGIFEDPVEAEKFKACDCPDNEMVSNCADLDVEYKIPAYHLDTIIKMITSTELKLLVGFKADLVNEGVDQNNISR